MYTTSQCNIFLSVRDFVLPFAVPFYLLLKTYKYFRRFECNVYFFSSLNSAQITHCNNRIKTIRDRSVFFFFFIITHCSILATKSQCFFEYRLSVCKRLRRAIHLLSVGEKELLKRQRRRPAHRDKCVRLCVCSARVPRLVVWSVIGGITSSQWFVTLCHNLLFGTFCPVLLSQNPVCGVCHDGVTGLLRHIRPSAITRQRQFIAVFNMKLLSSINVNLFGSRLTFNNYL